MNITSRRNEKVTHFKKLGASKAYRNQRGEYLCDGAKLLQEAVSWGADIHDVMVCGELPEHIALPDSVCVYEVTREVLEAASPLKTAQTVVFSVGIPLENRFESVKDSLILENVQDPGNVGAIIRTANAFGIRSVILLGACADPWNAKTVRASMGAVFREDVREMSLEELKDHKDVPIYGAALRRDARDIGEIDLHSCAVAIGNEGTGLTEEALSICDGTLLIPMNPECESLNAAAAACVIAWEMYKSR